HKTGYHAILSTTSHRPSGKTSQYLGRINLRVDWWETCASTDDCRSRALRRRDPGKSDQALHTLLEKRPPHHRWLVPAGCRSTAHYVADAANPPGDGWRCGGARLSGVDAECGLPRTGLAALLGGGQRPKGHFPEATHQALLAQVQKIMPKHAQVT